MGTLQLRNSSTGVNVSIDINLGDTVSLSVDNIDSTVSDTITPYR